MTGTGARADLCTYLQHGRDTLLWKLDGLGEYDLRRPMTPTGTNLLGLVKHAASTEAGYLGEVFGRPFPEALPWMDDAAAPNADMWVIAEESRDQIVDLYRRVWAHSDTTIGELALDAAGTVGWWPEHRNRVTLHQVLVHLVAETDRHAGHADIVRELIDGTAGWRDGTTNLAPGDHAWWADHRARLEASAAAARQAEGAPGAPVDRQRGDRRRGGSRSVA